jgi:hypothetical protein
LVHLNAQLSATIRLRKGEVWQVEVWSFGALDHDNCKSIATHALDRAQLVCMVRWLVVGYHTVALATLKS